MSKITIRDVDFKNKRVIVRVDFNVPLDEEGNITDDARITAAIPTINYIFEKRAKKIILMSHLGRPKGIVEKLRMNVVAERLSQLLDLNVQKLDDCVGENVKGLIEKSENPVVLLENLRFHPEEEAGDEAFAKELASLADIYVNDAFGTAHRAHASTTIIAHYLPSCLGFLMEKEVNFLSSALSPQKPYVVILGGAKVSDKIDVIKNLIPKTDVFLIGGAMAYTFLKSKGVNIGNSRVEEDKLTLAKEIIKEAQNKKVKIILPIDHTVVSRLDKPESKRYEEIIPAGYLGVDVGPKTVNLFKQELKKSKTILWNGPLGIFENPHYADGTKEIALFLADLKNVTVIVGGGDSASAAKEFGVVDKLSHVSTGGGASLEFLEGKELHGIAVIPEKEDRR